MHGTRQRIIEFLKEKREATVEELADKVDLTPMAVRYHLNVLQGENLIETSTVRRQSGPGRPQQIYRLTEAANELFPEDYQGLTNYILDELKQRLGRDGVSELFDSIAERISGEIPPCQDNETFEERLDKLVMFLGEKGFVSDWTADNEEYVIHTYSCPYRQVVKGHGDVCKLDEAIIQAMLNTAPNRVACLRNNDEHCIYHIKKPIALFTEPADM